MEARQSFVYRPSVWVCATAISLALCGYAYHFFPKAIPIISLDLTMNRSQALEKAAELARKHSWQPEGQYRQTALFDSDQTAKIFIELEGGGQKKLTDIMCENELALYSWNVRHFKENDAQETIVMFKPNGDVYGFQEKISQDAPGEALTTDQALTVAQENAQRDWNISFDAYKLIEKGQEKKSSGRIDHTFTYERTDKSICNAPYRLTLVVSGNKLTKVKPYLHVPDAFKRRYQHMRSFNESLATAAYFLEILLYLLGGGIIGLFFLLRKRALIVRPPILWALAIALGFFLQKFNELPLAWYHYPTTISALHFLGTYIVSACIHFFYTFGLLFITFGAAEGLTRLAFGNHVQLWPSWKPEVASSREIIGRTISGYLLVGLKIAFVISFYILTISYYGWWMPTGALVDPNILATYVPWFSPLLKSLMAGFREECFFRAIPLAIGMLLTKKYNQNRWVIGAFILQALIFGAAHANYPAQPYYARLVELSFSSCLFGFVYIAYGLLPVIICHYLYDIIWFALPIFISEAPGIWISRTFIICGAAIPLVLLCYAYITKRSITHLAGMWYNKNWKPSTTETKLLPQLVTPPHHPSNLARHSAYILGLLGLCAAAYKLYQPEHVYIPLALSHTQAVTLSKKYIPHINPAYIPLTAVKSPITQEPQAQFLDLSEQKLKTSSEQDQHWFVWRTLGPKAYYDMQQTYLSSPYWRIRHVTFEGDIEQRAHEMQVYLQADGTLIRAKEKLPEKASGENLTEQEAREQAYQALHDLYNKSATSVQEIIALPSKKPDRTDWKFVFTDTQQQFIQGGQARITIKIAGNKIVDHYRWVFVPEEHERSAEHERSMLKLIASLCNLIAALALACGAGSALFAWAYGQGSVRATLFIFMLLASKTILQIYNLLPSSIADFETSQPFNNQLFELLAQIVWGSLFKIIPSAVIAGFIVASKNTINKKISAAHLWLYGCASGICIYGSTVLLTAFGPHSKPIWPLFWHADARISWMSLALTTMTTFVTTTILLQFLWIIGRYIITGRKRLFGAEFIMCLLIGLCLMETVSVMSLYSWFLEGMILGCCIGAMYYLVIATDIRIVSIAVGTYCAAQVIAVGLKQPYPGALLGACIAIILIGLVTLIWNFHYIDNAKNNMLEK